jgi:hypothetical protein
MPQYLVSVWHDDTYETDFSTPDAQRRAAQVGACVVRTCLRPRADAW